MSLEVSQETYPVLFLVQTYLSQTIFWFEFATLTPSFAIRFKHSVVLQDCRALGARSYELLETWGQIKKQTNLNIE